MKKLKRYSFFVVVFLTSFLYSCDDLLNVNPKGQPNAESLSNQQGVEAALIGVYSSVNGDPGHLGSVAAWSSSVSNWVMGGVRSDDAYKGTVIGDQQPINALEGFFVQPTNQYVNLHWESMYANIARANDVFQLMEQAEDMPAELKTQVEAQLRFLRSHFYVELVRVHGNVPWIDETTEDPSEIPNDGPIWDQILADFQFAADNLPNRQNEPGRVTTWAAKTYMAYVYMYRGMYTEAKPILEDIYQNGGFSLMPEFTQNYMIAHNNNQESIWEIQSAVNAGGTEWDGGNAITGDSIIGMTFMGGSGFYQPSHNLVSAFRVNEDGLPEFLGEEYSVDQVIPFDETGQTVPYKGPVDPRLDHTIGRPGVPFLDWGVHEGDDWIRDPINGGPYINKKEFFLQAEVGSGSQSSGRTFPNANNYRKFKLSMVILWLAECEVEAGNLSRAAELVNLIRERAKQSEVVRFEDGAPAANYQIELYPVPFPNQEYARHAVRLEHRLELSMEGYRFHDLNRWGITAEIMNRYLEVEGNNFRGYLRGQNFSEGQHELLPIPQTQIDLSVDENGQQALTQNPGY